MDKVGTLIQVLSISLTVFIRCQAVQKLNQRHFPSDFSFGVASSSYQTEGAWNESGRGPGIWDTFIHTFPQKIRDGSTADVACDSYHKVSEDLQLLQNLGAKYYRFSVSWPRILPTGYINKINSDGIKYYNSLINGLLARKITPIVTIYHWDLPQPLQDIGGWPNSKLVTYFIDFADLVFRKFGDRVKFWITFNEIKNICKVSYGDGYLAPGLTSGGDLDYKCTATILKAHARAYDLYKKKYKLIQKGKIGFTVDLAFYKPASKNSADIAAADRFFDFYTGIFTNPIYGSGDFPETVKKFVAERSKQQGFSNSRLPKLSSRYVKLIRGSADFFGLNYYVTYIIQDVPAYPLSNVSWDSDARIKKSYDRSWPETASPLVNVIPWGLKRALIDVKRRYGDIPIMITENGFPDKGGLEDYDRANYLLLHLSTVLDAIYNSKIRIIGYIYWSMLDNFEWLLGYTVRFGLHDVDFTRFNRTRTAKFSASVLSNIIKTRKLPPTTIPKGKLQDVSLN